MSPDTTPPIGAGSDVLIRYLIEEQRMLRTELAESVREQSATFDRIWQNLARLHVELTKENGEHNGNYKVLCTQLSHQSMRVSAITSSIVSMIVGAVAGFVGRLIYRFFFT